MRINNLCSVALCTCLMIFSWVPYLSAQDNDLKNVEVFVQGIMDEAQIPGISLVVVKGDGTRYVKGFGYADLERGIKVSPRTEFELGSCSKSFTALAALKLEEEGAINLDHHVSVYLPGFVARYKGKPYEITIRQLLYHTSGIPTSTISLISPNTGPTALQETVRKLVNVELDHVPGTRFRYATINYDVVGAIIEKVSGKSYEVYMKNNIFQPLGLHSTRVGVAGDQGRLSKGYKIGFFAPRHYRAPIYRGNNPAGYIVSNGEDMARWLGIQTGLVQTPLSHLVEKSHSPGGSVLPGAERQYYYMGWMIFKHLKNEIRHSGLNPNFTTYVAFRPGQQIGIALMANSNSSYTTMIGDSILKMLAHDPLDESRPPENKIDAAASILSVILALIMLGMLLYLVMKIKGILSGQKKYSPITLKKIWAVLVRILAGIPLFIGVYIAPRVILGFSWQTVLVWGPISIEVLLKLLIASFVLGYFIYFLSLLFPDQNKYRNTVPMVMMLDTVSGLAGMAVLPIFMGSFFSRIPVGYILFYFGLVLAVNVLLSRAARTRMIHFSNNMTLDIRVDLIKRILSTRYQEFEKLLDGRIITILNHDVVSVTGAVNLFMQAVSNFVVVCAGLVYLTTISLMASAFVLLGAILIGIYYLRVSAKAKVYLEKARTAQNIATSLMNGMINGFKELSLHRQKIDEFGEDMVESCDRIRSTNIIARIKFLNSEVIAGALGTVVIGLFCILTPRLLTGINIYVLISLLVVILYLRAPITALIGIIPSLTGVRVSWGRIKRFNEDICPGQGAFTFVRFFQELDRPDKKGAFRRQKLPVGCAYDNIETLKVKGLRFKYKSEIEEEQFEVGPIDLELKKGEILFITGGNGSGKTTLMKLLSGLYEADSGVVEIDGKKVDHTRLGEHYSVIFSDYHLFKKLYEIDAESKSKEIAELLQLFKLESKVKLDGNHFSTIDLSGGQRKRLALVKCFLEGRSIYIFDELAANQDPEFRRFIYKELFPRLRDEGKIVIACTHDDHYFDIADKVVKMDMGKIDVEFRQENVLPGFVQKN